MKAKVLLSHVSDGSMYDRENQTNSEIIENRQAWLLKNAIALDATTRLYITYDEGNTYVKYKEVEFADQGKGMLDGAIENADALVTTAPGHALFLPVADCIATTLFDEENGVLMLSHLGRQSLEQNGGVASVRFMAENYNSKPEKLKIWLSASVSKELYAIFKLNNKGMKEVLYEQLKEAGVDFNNIIDDRADTGKNDDYFSYSEFLKGNKPTNGCHAMVAVMTSENA